MPRQQPKFTKLKYFVTLTCSHGEEANTNYYPSKFTKSKYIVTLTCSHGGQNEVYVANLHCSLGRLASALENLVKQFRKKRTQTTTRQTSKFPKSKYFVVLTCSHGGVKIKMKCTLHIYIWARASRSPSRHRLLFLPFGDQNFLVVANWPQDIFRAARTNKYKVLHTLTY